MRVRTLNAPHRGIAMSSVVAVVLPVFALIGLGWLVRRIGVLDGHATGGLNGYVVHLALPALLFDIVARADPAQLWQPGFAATCTLSAGVVFAVTVLVRRRRSRSLADASIDGLNASYANTGFIGFPLVAAVLGPAAMPATLVATIVTVCVLFAVALVLVEVGVNAGQGARHVAARVGGALVRNPLLVAPALGLLVLLSGWTLPSPVVRVLELLGASASPCALVALGLFLAEKRTPGDAPAGTVVALVSAKLFAHPLLAWLLATQVFALPPMLVHCAVLLAALPTGTGPFMVAAYHGREAALTARVVLVSTVASLVTVTAWLGATTGIVAG